ncbi:hypothetical protein M3N64_05750 [Sporolactobacillus sp. CPB3-1]|uniref:Uncharacterized protein n=2 Tax=Sporolactobacillus TaxID=2077 RepID=A0ABT0M9A4_9BACL|nr:hypothetical protein [Sporolactobacillus mangiferae]MCL1631455.1 hypothetical protein [Sporolactobacillus mangiferae]
MDAVTARYGHLALFHGPPFMEGSQFAVGAHKIADIHVDYSSKQAQISVLSEGIITFNLLYPHAMEGLRMDIIIATTPSY